MLTSKMLRALPLLFICTLAAAQPAHGIAPKARTAAQPDLKSASVLVLDTQTSTVLLARKADEAVPIASITKLMTSLVVLEAKQPMDEVITINAEDLQATRGNRSHLAANTRLTRAELMHLALMASENRAANALGRSYPGGLPALITAMNAKAVALGMSHSHFVEPTGLSSQNVASPQDLSRLVTAAAQQPALRRYSTDAKYSIRAGKREVQFVSTNPLVRSSGWDIALQKTGYISEGGKCLVMKTIIEGRDVIIVLLDSFGKYTRIADARRIRKWMESTTSWRNAIAQAGPRVAAVNRATTRFE
jgi:D-alanyl-D-alanine endopeptidase (penicillin-binding protein 7)